MDITKLTRERKNRNMEDLEAGLFAYADEETERYEESAREMRELMEDLACMMGISDFIFMPQWFGYQAIR